MANCFMCKYGEDHSQCQSEKDCENCKMYSESVCLCGKFSQDAECPYFEADHASETYKNVMNDYHPSVYSHICNCLSKMDEEAVHVAFESMLKNDDTSFVLVARAQNPVDYRGYRVYSYDEAQDALLRRSDRLTYPEALIEMGSRIKE